MTVPILASLLALQATSNSVYQMVFMYGAIFAIFYFVLIRVCSWPIILYAFCKINLTAAFQLRQDQ